MMASCVSIVQKTHDFDTCRGFDRGSLLFCCYIYYSKFDKDHYINFHWIQCNEHTPLALYNFRCFSLIYIKFAAVIVIQLQIQMQFTYLEHPVYARLSENAKYCFLQKSV